MNKAVEQIGLGATRTLANHVAGARFASLPPATLHAFKRALQDFITCAVSGAAMPVSKALLSYYLENDATRTACVIGNGAMLSAPNAALINGANTHGLDFDDGYTQGSCHPGGIIFSAAMSVAQQYRSTPQDIIVAVVTGYDVMLRIAAAMHPASAHRGFHNSPLAGVFGAAAAAARLLRLDATQTLNALGLAGSFSSGIREYLDEGAEIKRIHPGKAARDGVLCAEFARRGITGPSRVLEGRNGFFRTHIDEPVKWPLLLEGLGTHFEIESAYFKPDPCCRHYHAVIDGIKALKQQHGFSASDVAHANLGIYAVGVNGHDSKACESLLDAQMSAPCAAALALLYGDVTAPMFLPETLERPEFRETINRIDAELDDECERIYPGTRSGAVRIELRDGRVLEKRVIDPKGEVENPMTDADLDGKFISNCEPLIGRVRCETLRVCIKQFETLADATEFFKW